MTEAEPNYSCEPCPYCKSNDVSVNHWTDSGPAEGYFVRCYTCQTYGPIAKTVASAYEKWNNMSRSYQEDVIELPKDAEGVPIRPGDVLYGGKHNWVCCVEEIIYKVDEEGGKWWVFTFRKDGRKYALSPESFSHHPQTALDEIKRDIYYLGKKSGLKNPQEFTSNIIERIKKLTEENK